MEDPGLPCSKNQNEMRIYEYQYVSIEEHCPEKKRITSSMKPCIQLRYDKTEIPSPILKF